MAVWMVFVLFVVPLTSEFSEDDCTWWMGQE